MINKQLAEKLTIGAKIKIGAKYSEEVGGFKPGEVITLIEGYFDYENGLYTETQKAPSVWSEVDKDFDSIYHLFGNSLENFMDCEVIEQPTPNNQLPDEVVQALMNETQAATDIEEIRLKADYPEMDYGKMVSHIHGYYKGYFACATEYATKLHKVEKENKRLVKTLLEIEQGKLHQAQQEKEGLLEECKRLAQLVTYWQEKCYEVNPPPKIVPKIDNNPIG